MIKDLAIYGAGGFGREVALMVHQINEDKKQWNLLGFFDDGKAKNSTVDNLPVLGGIAELNAFREALSLVIGIAGPATRNLIAGKIKHDKIDYPVIVHPQSMPGHHSNKFGKGSIITPGCILTTGIHLADFVILNLATTVGHDVSIGAFSSIMPGCHISGNVKIRKGVLVGTGASILQNLTIGDWAKVGAGAVVVQNVLPAITVVGVPAKQKVIN